MFFTLNYSWLKPRDSCFADFVTSVSTGVTFRNSYGSLYVFHLITYLWLISLILRLIREIHEKLLSGGRGSNRNPGKFRTTQNWIGPTGCNLVTATFIPPTIPNIEKELADLELFFYEEDDIPSLIKIAPVR